MVHTQKEGKGIYLFELNEDSGQISSVNTGYEIEASTYLAQTDDYLYAITGILKRSFWFVNIN